MCAYVRAHTEKKGEKKYGKRKTVRVTVHGFVFSTASINLHNNGATFWYAHALPCYTFKCRLLRHLFYCEAMNIVIQEILKMLLHQMGSDSTA